MGTSLSYGSYECGDVWQCRYYTSSPSIARLTHRGEVAQVDAPPNEPGVSVGLAEGSEARRVTPQSQRLLKVPRIHGIPAP